MTIELIAAWASLAAIAAIGVRLVLDRPRWREENRGERPMLPAGTDPADLRRVRPLTNRLAGAVLITAVIVLLIALSPALRLS